MLLLFIAVITYSKSPTEPFEILIGGIQIVIDVPNSDNDLLCSIGFPAYYYKPPPRPDRPGYYVFGFVTASHCGNESYAVYQPNMTDPQYYRGYIERDPAHPRRTDSAFVRTETSSDFIPSTVDDKVLYYGSEIPILGYITTNTLEPGVAILYKTGRTTGTTNGYYLDTRLAIIDAEGGIRIENAIIANYYASGGDSGGPVYLVEYWGGSPYAWVLGVHSGIACTRYDTIWVCANAASPYDDIELDLGVTSYG